MDCRPAWHLPVMFLCLAGIVIITAKGSYDSGWDAAEKHQAALKSQRDQIMQKIGVCDWAKVMAAHIKCQEQLP
jgi:hypothetical protein